MSRHFTLISWFNSDCNNASETERKLQIKYRVSILQIQTSTETQIFMKRVGLTNFRQSKVILNSVV